LYNHDLGLTENILRRSILFLTANSFFRFLTQMKTRKTKIIFLAGMVIIAFFTKGCNKPAPPQKPPPDISLGSPIGVLTEVFSPGPIAIEGYGLVGGLNATGSPECPPEVRNYLEKYIKKQLPDRETDIDKLMSGNDTAVVLLQGLIPPMANQNEAFDIKVSALPGTQTTSIEDGWLYSSELKVAGSFGMAMKTLATAEGPVFIDTANPSGVNKKSGYILGGGRVMSEYMVNLALRQPDYRVASRIRNRLNERFGNETAKAVSESLIELKVPAKYKAQKERFISIVKAMYLDQSPDVTRERIMTFIGKLAAGEDKDEAEIALETIGNEAIDKLAALLNSSNEDVRFRAARCMLNLGNDKGLETLRRIAMDKNSSRRLEALAAITASAKRNDAAVVARKLLRDENIDVRLAAYESLMKLEDIVITEKLIGRSFYLEQIGQTEYKTIFASRSGRPRIALLGAPIYCHDNIFVESADGNITINAPAGQKYVSIIRKHPTRPETIIQVRSSFELGDIIRRLCEEPVKRTQENRSGLNVSYAEMIALLQQMCDKGIIKAEFRAGPLPKIGQK
jgi:hypothetical protein